MSRRTRFLILAMLVLLATLVIPALLRPAVQAQEGGNSPAPKTVVAAHFAVSPPLSSLPPVELVKPGSEADKERKSRPRKLFRPNAVDAGPGSIDGALQPPPGGPTSPALAMPATLLSFDGLASADNFDLFGSGVLPPDTDGDVGPNHYVQIVNDVYRVFDKAGNPLTPARKISSIFLALGTPCASTDDGDPIALYDPLGDRWLISQLCTIADPNSHQLIAVSQTGDPTGAYYLWDFPMPNNKFNDYPKFGVWPDAYYMTDNQFNQAGTAFLGGGAFAFNRAKMLVGDPTADFIYFDLELLDPYIGGMLPSDFDGLNPPPAGTPNYFVYFTADEYGDPSDALRIFEFHADFAAPASSTFTERAESPLVVPSFDPRDPSGRNDIEQPAGSNLDAIQDRLMYRLAYRNMGGDESLVVNHTVNVGPDPTTSAGHQSALRYYQLRRSLPGGAFALNDRATFAPDTDNRWMGSVAEDNQGNLAAGYSVSSTATFPSVRYAGRLAGDPPNGLFQAEASMVAGTGVQTHSSGRWGDYSAMSVDPSDDCTFWYTQQYYTAASQAFSSAGWLTRIGSFKFAECTPAAQGTIQGTVYNSLTSLPVPGAVVQTDAGHSRVTGGAGSYSINAVPGTYNMTASKPGYLSDAASGVVVVDGASTTQDLFLTPIPIINSAGASAASGESCSPATGGLDPGETVTIAFGVRNTGSADTVNLVGTLLPGGGVTSPSAPQSYGVVFAGGAAVSRSFTFTVDPSLGCGDTLTASLSLQDGASNLGTLTYTFTLGTLSNGLFPGTYSTGDIAEPILDVDTIEIPITVSDAGMVGDVNVSIRLDHTYDSDMEISLVHPDGTVVMLSDNRGGSGDNFGTGANDCSGTHTVFDDSAPTAIAGGTAPFVGSFRPDQPLSALDGKPVAGTWKLRIADLFGGDVGTVGCVRLEIGRRLQLCCPFTGGTAAMQAAPPATVVSEGCSPADGAADPNEQVSVSFPLSNVGTGATTNLVATLLPGGGVFNPGPAQTYGAVIPIGPPVSRTFTFTAQGTCGGSITATLHLQDGPTDLGNVTYTMGLGNYVTAFGENFDGVAAPALPVGWTATNSGATPPPPWATTAAAGLFVSPPNGAATDGNASVSENDLDSPSISVPTAVSARLIFQNNYDMESGYDGGVLEISIGGGPFADILAAGGSFATGGYNGTISTSFSNPLGGRQAWTGTSNGFVLTTVDLPAGAIGQSIQLRWRAGFDSSITPAGGGWRIDDVAISTFICCGPAISAAPPATVTSESCGPANSAPDPDETVTVSFPLRNIGTAGTADLVATLEPGGGVNSPGPPQSYGVVPAGGAPVARSFSFVPSGTCGGSITATLHLSDGTQDMGTISYSLQLGVIASVTSSFSNTTSISIPSSGAGTPYPSNVTVSGFTSPVTKVTVTLFGMNHTWPDDIDILLVGPAGQKVLLMSDAGGSLDLVNVNLTFDDAAAAGLPDSAQIVSGTYRPTNFDTSSDAFPAPAPAAPYGSALSVFNSVDPNGAWSLYVSDDTGGDLGNISGGWQLNLTASAPVCCSQACTLTCPPNIVVPNDPGQCGAVVGYPPFGVSGSCGVVGAAPPSGSFFPVGGTPVAGFGTSTSGGGTTGTCSFMVAVNDTEPPMLNLSTHPSILWPPFHFLWPVKISWQVADNCTPSPGVSLVSATSNEPDDAPGLWDGFTHNDIRDANIGTPDTKIWLRAERSWLGTGRIYSLTYASSDAAGNVRTVVGHVTVPFLLGWCADAMQMHLEPGSTGGARISWDSVSDDASYDLISGDLANVVQGTETISLGPVTVLAAGTQSTDFTEASAGSDPPVGKTYFYLMQFRFPDGTVSSYGSDSAGLPREPTTCEGGCP